MYRYLNKFFTENNEVYYGNLIEQSIKNILIYSIGFKTLHWKKDK